MSWAIGSLRRIETDCVMRGDGAGGGTACGGAAISTGFGAAGSAAFGRISFVAIHRVAKNGAGCEPDCRNTALITITAAAVPAPTMANESTGRRRTVAQVLSQVLSRTLAQTVEHA